MSNEHILFTVPNNQKKIRLDVILQEVTHISSRSQILKLIKEGRVFVNDEKVIIRKFIIPGDRIEIMDKKDIPQKKYELTDNNIIAQTKEYIVLSKPHGLIVHPANQTKEITLSDLIIKRYPEIKKIGEDPLRPGIVHRLDKDASGIMVIARTQDSFDHLKREFKLHRIKKEYLIMVYGGVTPIQGIIESPIMRSKKTGLFVVGQEGRPALTRYVVEKKSKHFSVVRVMPESGRTHQIRVHFFSRGYPLVGDTIYKRERGIKKISVQRLMLHASLLGFTDQNGVYCEYISQPDAEFLDTIRTHFGT